MNQFTKAELEDLLFLCYVVYDDHRHKTETLENMKPILPNLLEKLRQMVDTYCEHDWMYNKHNVPLSCNKCEIDWLLLSIYDKVKYRMNCPVCDKNVEKFETKSGGRWFNRLEYWQCSEFNASCDYCKTRIEFILNNKPVPRSIDDYQMRLHFLENNQVI